MKSFVKAASIAIVASLSTVPVAAQWHSVQQNREPMVTGSGRIVTQQRAVGNFSRIELKGGSNAEVRLGERLSVAVQADDNILGNLTSRVVGRTLVLDSRGSYRTRTAPRYLITVPNIDYLATQGSGNARIHNVANRSIELLIQGSGNVHATGRTGAVKLAVQGSGNGDLRGLASGSAVVSVMGSGNAWVATSGAVTASSFGSGNVYVGGRPASLKTQRAGSGRVVVTP
jgi:hypothetical protein